ncbi:hypothetical protein IMSAGC005_03024 [Lachnospiraceae bacterium]|nr:hypothetical protein IMSAGC005_03024 [Lachnospiraceae bacterium]
MNISRESKHYNGVLTMTRGSERYVGVQYYKM